MFKISLFKLRKNRRYNYTPRYYKGKDSGNIYDFDSKFTKYREIYNSNDFGQQWSEARVQMRTRKNHSITFRLLIIILILILACLFILDFDLSIFI